MKISEKITVFPIELGAKFVHGQYAKQADAKMVNLKGLKCFINCRGTVHDDQTFLSWILSSKRLSKNGMS